MLGFLKMILYSLWGLAVAFPIVIWFHYLGYDMYRLELESFSEQAIQILNFISTMSFAVLILRVIDKVLEWSETYIKY